MPMMIIDNYFNQTFWVIIWFIIISLYTKQFILPNKLEIYFTFKNFIS